MGHLYLLVLNHDGKRVLGLKLQSLGRTSAASTISYLDNAVVYVGSATGDSQLIRLHPEAVSPNQPSNFVEVLDTFTNLGPIVDFSVIDLDRQGQGQVCGRLSGSALAFVNAFWEEKPAKWKGMRSGRAGLPEYWFVMSTASQPSHCSQQLLCDGRTQFSEIATANQTKRGQVLRWVGCRW